MQATIKMNPQTNALLSGKREYDLMAIRQASCHLNDLLEKRGYVYANFIYEYLGVEWNPGWDNEVFMYDSHNRISFYIVEEDDGYTLHIIY